MAPSVRETPIAEVRHSCGSRSSRLKTQPEPSSASVPVRSWTDGAPRARHSLSTQPVREGRPPLPAGRSWRGLGAEQNEVQSVTPRK